MYYTYNLGPQPPASGLYRKISRGSLWRPVIVTVDQTEQPVAFSDSRESIYRFEDQMLGVATPVYQLADTAEYLEI